MTKTLFTNGQVLPCVDDGEVPFDGDVLVDGERIVEVSHGRMPGVDARIVDVGGAVVMPGLGDAHVHFGQPLDFEFDYLGAATARPEDAALATAAVARQYIEHGITTCVSGGIAQPRGDVALRDCIERGWVTGPRIIPGGEMVSDPDGVATAVMPKTADEMRKAVFEQCALGVKVIKLFLSGENLLPPGAPVIPVEQTFMTDELVSAAVEEAGHHGAFVNVHARGAGSVALAARCGVRLISHASYVDDEGLALMQARDDVWICPGVHYLWAFLHEAYEPYSTMAADSGLAKEFADAISTIGKIHQAGIPLVAGGDYGHVWQPHGEAAWDLQHFVDAGMNAQEAVLSGTRHFAGLTGLAVGQLAPGYFADLLVIDGDPTADISVLRDAHRRRAVVKGGEIAWVNPDLLAHL